jgi:predicted phosphodiesterase
MKLAVLSDIHGNVPALEAVLEDILAWRADEVIVNGDVINRGPYSPQVLGMLREHLPRAEYLLGNHESFTLYSAANPLEPEDSKYDLRRLAQWTATQLGEALAPIADWGDHLDRTGLEGGASLHITHGSRLGNRDGIGPSTREEELPAKLGEPRDLFVASHTHRPMVREFAGGQVVNIGSVGQPLDGDERAAYGRFELRDGCWVSEIRRVAYDKPRAIRDFHQSGFLDHAGPVGWLIYTEHRLNAMHVGPMMRRYLADIEAGGLSVREAVQHYLAEQGLEGQLREWNIDIVF